MVRYLRSMQGDDSTNNILNRICCAYVTGTRTKRKGINIKHTIFTSKYFAAQELNFPLWQLCIRKMSLSAITSVAFARTVSPMICAIYGFHRGGHSFIKIMTE